MRTLAAAGTYYQVLHTPQFYCQWQYPAVYYYSYYSYYYYYYV